CPEHALDGGAVQLERRRRREREIDPVLERQLCRGGERDGDEDEADEHGLVSLLGGSRRPFQRVVGLNDGIGRHRYNSSTSTSTGMKTCPVVASPTLTSNR